MNGTTEVEEGGPKDDLRGELTRRRRAMPPEVIDARGVKVQARLLATPYFVNARTVALYAPIRGEVPTRDILHAALAEGKVVVYPLSHVHGRVLSFRIITRESELEPGRLGVRDPASASEMVPLEQVDLFVVPGLGFSRDGRRLGRGGGYYDATLRAAQGRSRRVGLAFSDQIVDSLPLNEEDVQLDLVVTETEFLHGLFRGFDYHDT
ncbi:MAG: 5-formyltetrahydrofolate cyclo-ligase [Myxococcaceae bacterium]